MAVQVEVKLVCDPCRAADRGVVRATTTRRYGLDGNQYEVEVCDSCSKHLDTSLASLMRVSRKAGTKPKEVKRSAASMVTGSKEKSAKPVPVDRDEFFLWADMKGYKVNRDSQRLPGVLIKKFREDQVTAA